MSERARLKRLHDLQVVGTRGTGAFFTLAELAATLCAAPFAGISLIDEDKRWFFSSVGFRSGATPRARTCCERAIGQFDVTVFEDLDALRSNGEIAEPEFPEWAFYAAAPILFGAEEVIGALFVADTAPRLMSTAETSALINLSALAVESFRLQESLIRQQNDALTLHTQKEELAAALSVSRDDNALAAETARIGFWSQDPEADRIETSAVLRDMLALSGDAPQRAEDFAACFAGQAGAELRAAMAATAASGERLDMRLPVGGCAEEPRLWVRATAQLGKDAAGAARVYGCMQDVTELVESRQKVAKIATVDMLTGASNRRFLRLAFLKQKQRFDPSCESLQIVTIDIDNFKPINDRCGHAAGDKVLVEVARRLRGALREDDVLSRLGGDEFLVLRTRRAADPTALDFAESLRSAVRESPALAKLPLPVTLSAGALESADKTLEFSAALKQSDLAVYEAKRRGRNGSAVYQASMGAAMERRSAANAALGHALAAGAIGAAYAPRVAPADGGLIGLVVSPRGLEEGLDAAAMAAEADDPAVLEGLYRQVISAALGELGAAQRSGFSAGRVCLAAAPEHLAAPDFSDWLLDQAEGAGFSAAQLELSVSEAALSARAPGLVRHNLEALRREGAAVAFEQFGAGGAALRHLLEFEADLLKIDAGYSGRLGGDAAGERVFRAILCMARELGLPAVATGLADQDAVERAARLGCPAVQGAAVGAPTALDGIIQRFGTQTRGAEPAGQAAAALAEASAGAPAEPVIRPLGAVLAGEEKALAEALEASVRTTAADAPSLAEPEPEPEPDLLPECLPEPLPEQSPSAAFATEEGLAVARETGGAESGAALFITSWRDVQTADR